MSQGSSVTDGMHMQYTHPYHIIEFIRAGPKPKVKQVDVVATKWFYYDQTKKKCFVKYPLTPMDTEDSLAFNELLKNLSDAPSKWQKYSCRIRGRAITLDEALRKCQSLNEKESALTLESADECFSDAEQRAVQLMRQKALKESADAYKGSFSNIPEVSQTSIGDNHLEPGLVSSNMDFQMPYEDTGNRSPLATISYNLINQYKNSTRRADILSKDSSNETIINNKKIFNKRNCAKKDSKSSIESTLLSYMINFSNELREIKEDFKDIKKELEDMKTIMLSRSGCDRTYIVTIQQISEKFNYVIPITTMTHFEAFDNELKENPDLYNAVSTVLQTAVDKTLIISRSLTNMLKLFLAREIAVQFVASKSVQNKTIIKSTNLYNLLKIVITERRSIAGMLTSDKEISSALSVVLSNAGSWYKPSNKKVSTKNNSMKKRKVSSDVALPLCRFSTEEILVMPIDNFAGSSNTLQVQSYEELSNINDEPLPKTRKTLNRGDETCSNNIIESDITTSETSDEDFKNENYLKRISKLNYSAL